jgi:hypothetical protein
MGMPITANIIQIMKQTVNAIVLAITTDHALYFCVAMFPPSDRYHFEDD